MDLLLRGRYWNQTSHFGGGLILNEERQHPAREHAMPPNKLKTIPWNKLDPNFGFYPAQEASPGKNRQNFEYWVDWQYTQKGKQAAAFVYMDVRSGSDKVPLSFV